MADGAASGAVGFSVSDGRKVALAAKTVVLATGGLTRLYRRNSASQNMGGDGYALALRAGARLVDMEFVQFFPIGHLAPRLIGMDPIMWDPFRYKLGGRLLNSEGREFIDAYGVSEDGTYKATRDLATYAILKEVEGGRGSPAGGVYLSFRHVPAEKLRAAFGPVIDRLAKNGIDLTKSDVEVAPIAHYHMGGVRVTASLETDIRGLFAAGEAIGGANGANRLSGNAITEALVFGRSAGSAAAARAKTMRKSPWRERPDDDAFAFLAQDGAARQINCAALIVALQEAMARDVGPFRTASGLERALAEIARLKDAMGSLPPSSHGPFDTNRLDWFDLRNMLLVARAVAAAALRRTESRGAHQRDDFPAMAGAWALNQTIALKEDALVFADARVAAEAAP